MGSTPLTAVVVTYRSADVLPALLESLPAAFASVPYRLVVVDNASDDDTVAVARSHAPHATVIASASNGGYAAGINRGLAGSRGHALVLNADLRLSRGSVPAMLHALDETGVGIVVPRLRDARGALLPSLRREPTIGRALGEALLGGRRAGRFDRWGELVVDPDAYDGPTRADWATGAAMLISRECRLAVGPWDESFFLYSEETDYCLRARDAGFELRLEPRAEATHLGGEANTSPDLHRLLTVNRVRLIRRRRGVVASQAFRAAVLVGEVVRTPRRTSTHRAAARALLGPIGQAAR